MTTQKLRTLTVTWDLLMHSTALLSGEDADGNRVSVHMRDSDELLKYLANCIDRTAQIHAYKDRKKRIYYEGVVA